MNAISLNSLVRKGIQIIGPSLGGLSVAAIGVAPTYFVNAVSYVVLLGMIVLLRTTNPPASDAARSPARALLDGIAYVRTQPIIYFLLLLECILSLFGSYNPMLVVFAREVFGTGSEWLGLLQAATGIGSVVGSLVLGARGDIEHKGCLTMVGGVVYALAVVLFALTPLAAPRASVRHTGRCYQRDRGCHSDHSIAALHSTRAMIGR
jgi:predicted MFS family arabinose efflux permease